MPAVVIAFASVAAAAALLFATPLAALVQASDLPGCPAPFFTQDANAYPATLAVDQKGNNDGVVCVLILGTPDTAHAGFVIIDNTVH